MFSAAQNILSIPENALPLQGCLLYTSSTGKSGIKGIYLVWNMVDGREKTELYKAYDKVCAEFALPILETYPVSYTHLDVYKRQEIAT